METPKSFPILGAALALTMLISQVSAIPSLELFRVRREANSSPEPEPEAAATTMMTSDSSPISVTVSSLSSSSPAARGDMEFESDMGDDNNSSDGDSSTMMPETSTGKGIKGRVKDAMNSAEGWIKNAGQNIKEGFNKAKESIKHTASDVKEKVKKGMDSMSNDRRTGSSRSKNGTSGSDADCEAKDGKCSTDMPNENTSSSSNDSSSTENSQSPMPPTTNAPGYKKMRRRRHTYGANRYNTYTYPSSGLYSGSAMQYGARPYGSSELTDYSWRSRNSGNRDINRRYKRSQNMEGNATESMSTSSRSANQKNGERRQKREYDGSRTTNSRSQQTSVSTTTTSGDSTRSDMDNRSGSRNQYGRVKREANQRKMEESFNMTASSTEAMSTSAAEEDSTEEHQNKYGHHHGNSASSNSSFSVSVHVVSPQQWQPGRHNEHQHNQRGLREGRGPIYFSDEQSTQLDAPPVLFPDGSYGEHGKHQNHQNHQNNYNNYNGISNSYNKRGGRYKRGFNGYSQMGNGPYNSDYPHEDYGQYYPILESGDTGEMASGPGSWGIPHGMGGDLEWTSTMGPSSYDSDQQYYHHFNNQQGHQNGNGGHGGILESGTLDMGNMPGNSYHESNGGYYGNTQNSNNQNNQNSGSGTNSGNSGVNRPSHNFYNGAHHHQHNRSKNKHNKHPNDQENTDYYSHGVMHSGDMNTEGQSKGACRPIATAKKCNMLRDDSAQCLYDTDCSGNLNKTEGTKKCCFYHCDPYKIVGICEHVSYTVTSSS